MQLHASTHLEPAPAADFKLRDGETLVDALTATRNGIKSLAGQLQVIRRAPLPLEDRKKCAAQYVERLAISARPTILFDVHDQMSLRFKDSVVGGTDDVLALMAWAAPDQLCSVLESEITQMPTAMNAMPAAERMARVAEFEKKQLELERIEEAMIMRASGDGIELLRRPDAAPAAVLGVVIAKARQEVA